MSDAALPNPTLDFGHREQSKAARACETVSISGAKISVTPVFYAYWRFAAERQSIFYRRLNRTVGALTDDPVLRNFKFTNAYRASDRVSQYLIRNVIYRDDLPRDNKNLFFRILLFKLFNKIETRTALQDAVGPLTWETFDFKRYAKLLTKRVEAGHRIYSAAYIMPSAGSVFGHKFKHQNHLSMLERLIQEHYPERIASSKTMAQAYALLRSAPSIRPADPRASLFPDSSQPRARPQPASAPDLKWGCGRPPSRNRSLQAPAQRVHFVRSGGSKRPLR